MTRRLVRWIAAGLKRIRPHRSMSGLRILLYHSVGGKKSFNGYNFSIGENLFRQQMQWLRDQGQFEIVGLGEGVRGLSDSEARPRIAITFDDGYRDNFTVAAPILAELGLPFAVFITAGFLEGTMQGRGPYMSFAEVKTLSSMAGVTIGAHGYSHRPLTRCSKNELREELAKAKESIEAIIGRSVVALSYPHGAVNRCIWSEAQLAGYDMGATSIVGINRRTTPWLRLRRTEILDEDGMEGFFGKLEGDYDWYSMKQRLYWPVPS